MDKKLKIAIVGSRGYPYVYSGYETLVKELSERMVNKGHRVRVYCHRSLFKDKPRFVNGIELIYTPSIETKFLSQIINSFFSFFHVCFSSADIVFVVNTANGPYGILTKIFGLKTCINVDGLEWMRPKWKGLGKIYFKIASRLSVLFFDKIITDSLEMKNIYKNNFKISSTVIAYGSTMDKSKKGEVLSRFKLEKMNYYLIVGRLIPDNNSKLIIEGFINSNSNKKLVVVGDVPYIDSYASDVKKINSNKIIFAGYVNDNIDLSNLYQNCYGYIHGHEFGGTNPTMINALYLNCEILAINTVFSKEMLENKQVIFFEKNIKNISKSIDLFENKYNILKKNNRNYSIPKKYKWSDITNKYLDTFFKLTNYQKR